MSRSAPERLTDILAAVDRTLSYRPRLDDSDPVVAAMAHDAVLRNLAVIGEAVRALPEEVKAQAPEVPWPSIAGLRNVVVHELSGLSRTWSRTSSMGSSRPWLRPCGPARSTPRSTLRLHPAAGARAPGSPRSRAWVVAAEWQQMAADAGRLGETR